MRGSIEYIKERFIELNLSKDRSEVEEKELRECERLLLDYYEERAWQMGRAMNFLKMAHMTNDWDWVKQIGVEMEQMREEG